MSDAMPTVGESPTTWVRWAAGIILVMLVNLAAVAYYAGGNSAQTQSNTQRIDRIEQLLETTATKSQINDLKDDFKDMRNDIKDIARDKSK